MVRFDNAFPDMVTSYTASNSMTLLTFFQVQLDRLLSKPSAHAPGIKKPSLSQQDYDADRTPVGKIK